MASRSPTGSDREQAEGPAHESYLQGWVALARMMHDGLSWSGHERNVCLANLGDGRFADVSAVSGLDFLDDGRAVVSLDQDGDGDLDLWLRNRTGPQLRFLRNQHPRGTHWIGFELVGTTANRDAVGARVTVVAGGLARTRSVVSGDGYLAQSSRRLHFGLADATRIEHVEVAWPGGATERFDGPAVDRTLRIVQGSGKITPSGIGEGLPSERRAGRPARPVGTGREAGASVEGAASTRVLLKVPLPLPPSITGVFPQNEDTPEPTTTGVATLPPTGPRRATLVNLWAAWCAPCVEELTALAERADALREVGLDVVALDLDEPGDREGARRLFEERIAPGVEDATFRQRPLDEGTMETIDALLRHVLLLHGEVKLPTSLLVDTAGRLQMIYIGPVTPERLLADTRTWALGETVQPARRTLQGGRWYYRTPRPLGKLANELKELGRVEDAHFYVLLDRGSRLPR